MFGSSDESPFCYVSNVLPGEEPRPDDCITPTLWMFDVQLAVVQPLAQCHQIGDFGKP
jgi:hypothetical protein